MSSMYTCVITLGLFLTLQSANAKELVETCTMANPVSEVWVSGTPSTSHGTASGYTKVRAFDTTGKLENGSDISYTASVNNSNQGDKFVINADGIYTVDYTEVSTSVPEDFGVTVNCLFGMGDICYNALSIFNIPKANRLGMATTAASNYYAAVSSTKKLSAGDVIRAQDTGNGASSSNYPSFRITQVARCVSK